MWLQFGDSPNHWGFIQIRIPKISLICQVCFTKIKVLLKEFYSSLLLVFPHMSSLFCFLVFSASLVSSLVFIYFANTPLHLFWCSSSSTLLTLKFDGGHVRMKIRSCIYIEKKWHLTMRIILIKKIMWETIISIASYQTDICTRTMEKGCNNKCV